MPNPVALRPFFPCQITFYDIPYMYGSFLAQTQLYTRFLLSMSRFFAISFDGIYFKKTLKYPFVQVGLAGLVIPLIDSYLVAAYLDRPPKGAHWIAPEKLTTFFGSAMLAIDVLVFINMRKRQQTENSNKNRAEQKLAIQMVGNSSMFLGENLCQFFGLLSIYFQHSDIYIFIWCISTVLRAVSFMFSGILTVVFIRPASTEKMVEITHVSSTDSSKSSTSVASNVGQVGKRK
ncbi:unnamed protein product, partial [Mesorhabditis belari]|uniref:Uncharacterized protein n=1 Tax=Mesorhabditis belari TaxID=2138241 RepID=A0AAF3F785_9BILA